MHIPENYLSPSTCAVMTAAMLPIWAVATKKVKAELPKEKIPMLGIGAAFSFLGMMFNVPLIGGTTGHAVCGTLVALLFGPEAACIAISIALLLQALIFGDGGILSFGANCFNMAFILPFTGYWIYTLINKYWKSENTAKSNIAAAIGSYIGLSAAAFFTAIEFGIQPMLFKDALGHALYCPYDLSIAIPAMMIPHLAVAGFVEAIFTVAIFSFVKKVSPDLTFENIRQNNEATDASIPKKSYIPLYIFIVVLIAATPLGLLATGTAWGEWDASEIKDVVTDGTALGYTPEGLEKGWSMEALMPDYAINGVNENIAYILSAIIGVAQLIIIFKLTSIVFAKKKQCHAS